MQEPERAARVARDSMVRKFASGSADDVIWATERIGGAIAMGMGTVERGG